MKTNMQSITEQSARSATNKPRIYTMPFAKVYACYIAKAERKNRTKKEVDEIITWLTGYTQKGLETQIEKQTDIETFFAKAPKLNPLRTQITGTICGVKISEIKEPLMKEIRYLDKQIDDLAKGKNMQKILFHSPAGEKSKTKRKTTSTFSRGVLKNIKNTNNEKNFRTYYSYTFMNFEAKAVSKNYVEGKIYDKNVIFYKPEIDALYEQKKLESASLPESEVKLTDEELLQHALPINVSTKVLVYEDQITTWFLDIAKKLKKDNEAGFVIILITCAQIESNQQYYNGKSSKNDSKKSFVSGIRRFFKDFEHAPENILNDFYDEVRCGLMHEAMTKHRVTINADAPNPIQLTTKINTNGMEPQVVVLFENGKLTVIDSKHNTFLPLETISIQTLEIVVNPHLFLDTVEKGIKEYIEKLKDSNEISLRNNFERFFDKTR